jgi:hypothetical protein
MTKKGGRFPLAKTGPLFLFIRCGKAPPPIAGRLAGTKGAPQPQQCSGEEGQISAEREAAKPPQACARRE